MEDPRAQGDHVSRVSDLKTAFTHKFNQAPEFVARAPGRVNLIGEHIDYHGYAVLPMAISQDVMMAVAPNNATHLHLSNVDPNKYKDFRCAVDDFNFNHMSKPQWQHYVMCGLKGVQEQLEGKGLPGMDIMIDGNVPANAGLSSSSALVCCSALAAVQVCGLEDKLKPDALATLCAKSERYIGTEGGGMDQAISFLARAGFAKLIEFDPLRSTDIPLPSGVVFVVANCCVELNKAATSHFNTRVAEGRIAVQILAKVHNQDWRKITKAQQLHKKLGLSLHSLVQLVEKTFKEGSYNRGEICDWLGIGEEEFEKTCLSAMSKDVKEFELRKRLRHVFSEADRVRIFKDICQSHTESHGDAGSQDNPGRQLGTLMQDSHVSCRDDYECSCPELDELVAVMQRSGAYGARLTGAGWGGCAVALVPEGVQQAFLDKVREEFFHKDDKRMGKLPEALFVTSPAQGARIIA